MKNQTISKTEKNKIIILSNLNNRDEILDEARKIVEPVCQAESIELVHLEFQRESRGTILRVYIDKPQGVTLNDCVLISRQIEDLLEANLETDIKYNLEVSSPGFNRPLGKLSDFERFIGNLVKIKTKQPINGQKNFTGTLQSVSGIEIQLLVTDNIIIINYHNIIKARLVK